MRLLTTLFLTVAVLSCQLSASATGGKKTPADSAILGNVLDATTKKPVSEVIVSVSSGKQSKKKEVRSDGSGSFYFPQLPPGEFTLFLEKKGYKSLRKDYIMIKDGIQVSILMELEEDESEVDTWNPLRVIYGK